MKKILYVAAECMPFAAAGGLGDVIGSLPAALKSIYGETADIRVAVPLYGSIPAAFRKMFHREAASSVCLSWRRQYCGIFSLYRDGVLYYFIDNEYYFARQDIYGYPDDGERFAFFSMAVLDMLEKVDFYPDILHAHDWQGAISVIYQSFLYGGRPAYAGIKTVFTIHNIEYQGRFSLSMLEDVFGLSPDQADALGWSGEINLMQGAIILADQITTVSPTYAAEILTPAFGRGLDGILQKCAAKLCGILNGIDYTYYNPADSATPLPYTKKTIACKKENKLALQRRLGLPRRGDVPVFAVISRLVGHKGCDLLHKAAKQLLTDQDAQLIVLGAGEDRYEACFRELENSFPEKMRALILYDRDLSREIYAGSDFFLMPSASEPCGLSQMIACRYGSIPIVRRTGGLADSIKSFQIKDGKWEGCGLVFQDYHTDALYEKITQALDLFQNAALHRQLAMQCMEQDFSWNISAGAYARLYQRRISPKKG